MHTFADQTNFTDLANRIFEGLLILGLTERTIFLLLSSVDRLVSRSTYVEGVELVVLQLVLVSRSLVASLKFQICLIQIFEIPLCQKYIIKLLVHFNELERSV